MRSPKPNEVIFNYIKEYGLLCYSAADNTNKPVENVENNIDSEVLCVYDNPYTKNKQVALVSKDKAGCGFKEILAIVNKAKYRGRIYRLQWKRLLYTSFRVKQSDTSFRVKQSNTSFRVKQSNPKNT